MIMWQLKIVSDTYYIWYQFGVSCNLPKFRNFLGLSGKLGSGTDSSQYGEKNEMMNTKKITLVKKTANFKERDAKNHSPNAIMFSLVSVGADNVFWTDSLHYCETLFTHILKLKSSWQIDYIHTLVYLIFQYIIYGIWIVFNDTYCKLLPYCWLQIDKILFNEHNSGYKQGMLFMHAYYCECYLCYVSKPIENGFLGYP